ncbi:MAG: adenylate/guanylate cyclase domain-containing protein, partial [Actinomycetota bacterium]|nr:adenylate/guanylate cyclase domain-containing protein [Actinomycetota bacterium]
MGSTSIAETMDPEDWADIVGQTVAGMAGCIERYDGTVVQFAGDAVLAIFGAPVAHEDDPYRAVRAGLDIIDTVGRSVSPAVEIEVRAGIHTGLVIVGDVSAGDLSTYTALGDTTNVAARMQTMAAPGTLLVSADTHRLVANDVTARDLGPVEVKGKADPITVFEITSVRDLATRRRGIPGFQSPMVGRDIELSHLVDLADYAAAGSGRVTAIVGDPGVGKSRLVAELQSHAETMDRAKWVVGRSASYDQHRPYHLVASLVLSLADASASEDPQIIKKAVTAAAEPTFGIDSPSTGHLLQLLGLEEGHPDDEPDVLHAYYDTALAGLIAGAATAHAPLFVILEDVHWADPSSSELLAGMLERVQQSAVLLVIVSRPDRQSHGWDVIARADRELGESFTETRLRPLGDGDSRELVANLLEIEALSDDLRQQILGRAEGNPFFIEEVVRMLVDRDLIEEKDGRWIARGEISSLDVPETLHGLLASRIDGLATDVRRTAMVAAVIGRRFEKSLLTSVLQPGSDAEETSISAHLHVLEAQGMTKLVATRPELAFTFRHALIHDVTYASILKKDRRRLHAEVGDAIARQYPDRLEEHAATLARHYEEAGDQAQTLHYLLLA